MKIIYINGNLLDAQTDVIAHQVNCQGVMGSGIAKQIRDKWPIVFKDYRKKYEVWEDALIGECQLVQINECQHIANLFGQHNYGKDGRLYTSYDGIYDALNSLAVQMMDNGMESLAIPYGMSCGLAGGDWRIIMTMIECVFENTDIRIEIWKFK